MTGRTTRPASLPRRSAFGTAASGWSGTSTTRATAAQSAAASPRRGWIGSCSPTHLQFDLGQLAEFVPHTADAQLVVGYRAKRNDPLIRRLNADGWNALVHLLSASPSATWTPRSS